MKRVIGSKARCLVAIVALAVIGLSSPGLVKADIFFGSLYVGTAAASDATVANQPAGTPTVTFSTTAIGFNDTAPQSNATIAQFLATNSAPVTILTGAANTGETFTTVGNLVTGGYILFTGTTGVTTGGTQTYTVTHDDGAELQVNGTTVISAPLPTSREVSTGTINLAAGDYNFKLAYGEVNGTPAIIQFSPPAELVPEPSTLAIAGLGALGMIGYGLRRRKAIGA